MDELQQPMMLTPQGRMFVRRASAQVSSDEFDQVLRVNVRGTFEMIKAVLPAMRRQGYGKIVNIASGTLFKGTPFMVPYAASKGALLGLTRSVAREVGVLGFRPTATSWPGRLSLWMADRSCIDLRES